MNKSTFRLTVRGCELDSFGHVNNAVYLQYAETAVWNFFRNSQLLDMLFERGLFPVILESTQRYIHELKIFDEVRIESEFRTSGGIINYKHKIFNEGTGKISCKVNGKLAFVDHDRVICSVPDELMEYLESDNDDNKN